MNRSLTANGRVFLVFGRGFILTLTISCFSRVLFGKKKGRERRPRRQQARATGDAHRPEPRVVPAGDGPRGLLNSGSGLC
jgi:hypothetical protein